jgi:hypothetical protein
MKFHEGISVIQMEPSSSQQLTGWMGFHEGILVIQRKPRRCAATHSLDEISSRHISDSNGSPGAAQQLTTWMGFHKSKACQ